MICRRAWLLLCLAAASSACGYRLRGAASDLEVAIRARNAERIAAVLRGSWERPGTRFSHAKARADVVLELNDEEFLRRGLGVSPLTGRHEEFEHVYRVAVALRIPGGDILFPAETVVVYDALSHDREGVLGKTKEENLLLDDMVRRAADRIAQRLRAAREILDGDVP